MKKNITSTVFFFVSLVISSFLFSCTKEEQYGNTASFTMKNQQYKFENYLKGMTRLEVKVDPTQDRAKLSFNIFDKYDDKNYIGVQLFIPYSKFKADEEIQIKTISAEKYTLYNDIMLTFHYTENGSNMVYGTQGGNNTKIQIVSKPNEKGEILNLQFELPDIFNASTFPSPTELYTITQGKIHAQCDSYTWETLDLSLQN